MKNNNKKYVFGILLSFGLVVLLSACASSKGKKGKSSNVDACPPWGNSH